MTSAVRISPSGQFDEATPGTGPVSVLDFLLPGGSIVDAINDAFADELATEVYFPPYEYLIDGPIESALDGKVIRFVPGAVLVLVPQVVADAGIFTVSGGHSQIVGDLLIRIAEASSETFVALDLAGEASTCAQVRFEVDADVPNAVLLRQSADFTVVGDVTFAGEGGSFDYGLELSHSDGTTVSFARFGSLLWQMTDDGVHTRNFSALLRYRSIRSRGGPISIEHGGRHFFNAIVEVDGQHNSLLDPQIDSSSASNFGVLMKDDAEFFAIYDGEIKGNYLANSVGISCGDGSKLVGAPIVGQLKCYNTKITNWDVGVLITGSADAPGFFGATIANNKLADVRIDSKRGSDVWPVSGLSFHDCYREDVAFPGSLFLHLKTGDLLGGIISGGELGFTGTAVQADATMGTNVMQIDGARLPASAPTDAFTTPNANSAFYFGLNALSGSNLIGKGANAAKATSITAPPTLTSLTVGSSGTAVTKYFSVVVSMNFSTNLEIGEHQDVVASVPGVAVGDQIAVSVPDAIWYPGDVYTWRITGAGQIVVTRIAGFHVAAGAGNVRLSYWKH